MTPARHTHRPNQDSTPVEASDRVGGGGLCPPEPERGKAWQGRVRSTREEEGQVQGRSPRRGKPSQGFHENDSGFTITELMVVVVIIGIMAAVATPSFTKDNSARKGREFARMVAQTMQRAHLDAMSTRVSHLMVIYANRMEVLRTDSATVLRTIHSPSFASGSPSIAIWNVLTTGPMPTSRVLGTDPLEPNARIFFNPTGNAGLAPISSGLTNFQIYIRNEALASHHPDAGYLVSVTGLTSFVSTRNIGF